MSSRYVITVLAVLWLQATFIKDTYGQQTTCVVDLAILVDMSGSICDSDKNFDYTRDSTCQNWNFIVGFVREIVQALPVISPDTIRVAMITFATTSTLRWNLTAYPTKDSLLNAINTTLIYNKGGQTDTTGALNLLSTQVFGTSGDRPGVLDVAIVITDGLPTNLATALTAAQVVHNLGIRTIIVGVTDQVDLGTLKSLSSAPQMENVTYFWARDYSLIDLLQVQVISQACTATLQTMAPSQTAASASSTAPVTAPPTAPPIVQPTAPSTAGCNKIDLCFLIDRSGSICDNDLNFVYQTDDTCSNWASIVTFIHGFVSNLVIGSNNVQVALVIFASSSQVVWGLTNYTNSVSLLNAIDNIPYIKGGTTDTTGGLNLVNTQVYNTPGDRPEASNMVIIITDGKPTVPSTVPAAIQAVHDNKIQTFVVGITDSVDVDTLKLLSSPPQLVGITYFIAANYSIINALGTSLQVQACGITTTIATAAPGSCSDVQDITLVVDRSGSICDSDSNFNFVLDQTCSNWGYIVQFLHNLVAGMNIGPSSTRVALIVFSNDAELFWGLDAFSNKNTLLLAIDSLQYVKGGTTDTTGALNVLKDQVYTPLVARPSAQWTALIITDGKPTVSSTVPAAINAVQANNIRTLVIGVTSQVDSQTLIQLASPPKTFGSTVFLATDYKTIDGEVRTQLLAQACPGSATTAAALVVSTAASTVSTTMSTPSSSMAPPTSSSTVGSTKPGCNLLLDLCFVVDGSGSICDTDPDFHYGIDTTCNNWNFLLTFIKGIVGGLPIDQNSGQIRVGMVTFASSASILWNLTTYTTSAALQSAITNMKYPGGNTDTTGGLDLMRTVFGFSTNRPTANKTAIIITDGLPTVNTTVPAAINAVHAAGIKTLVVGVTNQVDVATLALLSSPPQQANVTYFTATNFDALTTVTNVIQQQTCRANAK